MNLKIFMRQNKIEKRMSHLKEKTRIELHRQIRESPPSHFDDIF